VPLSTLEDYRSRAVVVAIHGVKVTFYAFNDVTIEDARAKAEMARTYLTSMPREHLAVVFPILFIPGQLPSTGGGGGTPDQPDVLIQRRTSDIGATTEALQDLLQKHNAGRRRSTFHWIPPHVYSDAGRLPFTVAHEAIHGVDINLRLRVRRQITPELATRFSVARGPTRAFTEEDLPARLPGQACGAGTAAIRISVNAYLSLISGMRGAGSDARRQIVSSLRLSQAFETVPDSWWATYEQR
jgi:hypothetical protein